jgi:hypothetical protein
MRDLMVKLFVVLVKVMAWKDSEHRCSASYLVCDLDLYIFIVLTRTNFTK